jgi:hypothetical protein
MVLSQTSQPWNLFLQCETDQEILRPEADVTPEQLQQAFIEKFEWNHLPRIYIKDPRFGVQQ